MERNNKKKLGPSLKLYDIFPIALLAHQYHDYGFEDWEMVIWDFFAYYLEMGYAETTKKIGINIKIILYLSNCSFSTSISGPWLRRLRNIYFGFLRLLVGDGICS